MSSLGHVPKVAAAPFDASDADVILHTSDNVHFYIYRLILTLVSPFFRDMFTLPNPDASDANDGKKANGLPVIPVTEDSVSLDRTLRFVYPGLKPPVLSTWEEVEPIFEAFIKYQMEKTAPFTSILTSLLDTARKAPGNLDTSKDQNAEHWRAYASMRVLAKVEKFRNSLPEGTTARAVERASRVPFFELIMAYVDELDGWSARDFISLMKCCRAEALDRRDPSFEAWENDDPRWSFTCWNSRRSKPTAYMLSKELMVEWFKSNLLPSLREVGISGMHILPYEPNWSCPGCNQACRQMVSAAIEIFRKEIGDTLSMRLEDFRLVPCLHD
ncbi:hypothetical protein VNI00_016286 [Paramarasmius palmivorus]|uniref:BTB domain-containing protein n=1 Tax=Paramarasmius palmivorus TaxID=297713 RepID=A0AAW0BEK6_9AGAR